MTTLRITFYLLVALNLICGAVIAMPWLGMEPPFLGATEPDRVTSQVFPERLRVMSTSTEPPSAPGAENMAALPNLPSESAPAMESAPVQAPAVAAEASSLAAPAAAVDSAASVCVAFKNLTGVQAQALAQRARGVGNGMTVREEAAPSSYWVNIPAQGGKAGADRRAAELKKLGLDDFYVEQAAGENQYAISLGLFRAEGLAERQLETLQKRGVKGAKITARDNPNGARVELQGTGAQIERIARDGSAEVQGAQRDTCKPG